MHELRAYNSYTKLQQPNKTNLSVQNKSKIPKLSLTPKPSRPRVKQVNNANIDLTSTILDANSVRTETEFDEIQHARSELSRVRAKLTATIQSYENKLNNAEYIIDLLRGEIKGQLKSFRDDILNHKEQSNNSTHWENKLEVLKQAYEARIKQLEYENLCTKCKAFAKVSDDIQEKKDIYKYLY